MEQGNPNKVNTIVDEIVKNNNVFKLKSPIEQDKEKDSMARSINSALSTLNEVGKELVLQDLSVDPDEKFKGFIDSAGNIDISGLTKMTATIVKTKIEEAEREGLNLRVGEPVSKNNKLTLAEGTLALVAVNSMLNNFDILTPEQRCLLRENYESLNSEQRKRYDKCMLDKIQNSNLDDTTKKDLQDFFEGNFHSYINKVLDTLQKRYGTDSFNLSNIAQSEILKIIEGLDIPDELKKELTKYDFEKLLVVDKGEQNLADLNVQRQEAIDRGDIKERERLDKLIEQYKISPEHQIYLTAQKKTKSKQKEESKNQNSAQRENDLKNKGQNNGQDVPAELTDKQTEKTDAQQTISQEIEQIPITLEKAKFSREQIKESLDKYAFVFKNMDEADINEIKKLDKNQLKLSMKTVFSQVGMDEQIAEILSQITYNGQLFNILGNDEKKKDFFEQFDKIINQEHAQDKNAQLTGELEEILGQYFRENAVDMNVSAIEAQQQQSQQENQQAAQEQQPKESPPEQPVLPVAEDGKKDKEEQTENGGNGAAPASKQEETSKQNPKNLPIEYKKRSIFASIFGGIKNILSNMKNKTFGKPKKIVEEQEPYKQIEEDDKGIDDNSLTEPTALAKQPLSFDDRYQVNLTPEQIVQATSSSKSQPSQSKTEGKQEPKREDDDELTQ